MIGWDHLVEIKRIEELDLIILSPTHHAPLPLMPVSCQRNHGSRVVSIGVLQHNPPESGHACAFMSTHPRHKAPFWSHAKPSAGRAATSLAAGGSVSASPEPE